MKTRRDRIIELINEYEIDTQLELTQRLIEEGYETTQSTISRDIRKLQLTKTIDNNGHSKYVLPKNVSELNNDEKMRDKYINVLNDGILDMVKASNLLVINTHIGMAMAVATAIDALKIDEIIGCIAGDDTVFCAISDEVQVNTVIDLIYEIIKENK